MREKVTYCGRCHEEEAKINFNMMDLCMGCYREILLEDEKTSMREAKYPSGKDEQ